MGFRNTVRLDNGTPLHFKTINIGCEPINVLLQSYQLKIELQALGNTRLSRRIAKTFDWLLCILLRIWYNQ